MDVQAYKRKLLELEAEMSRRATRLREDAIAQAPDSPSDGGDLSVSDFGESEALTEAELDATTLQEVREALQRIEDGTFGRCVVDGGPIEKERLEAIPWTRYCAKHARQLEAAAPTRTPTL
jgi:DnaK suppressor protein